MNAEHVAANVHEAWRVALQYSIAYSNPLDELVSAAYEGLVRAGHAFDPARDRKFWGYAKHRVRGMVMDTIRRRARRNEKAPMVSLESVRPQFEMHIVDPLLMRRVWRELDRMDAERRTLTHGRYQNRQSPSRRTVIEMFYLQDMSMADIGERLGCDESRVSQIHLEALAVLRRALAPRCAIPGYQPITQAVTTAGR